MITVSILINGQPLYTRSALARSSSLLDELLKQEIK